MKILLSHSYFLRFDPKQWNIGLPYAPLGTLYAAATLRQSGYEVAVFDTMFSREAFEVNKELEGIKPDLFVIYDDGFNYLTKMCLTNMREAAFEMIRLAKQKGSTVIVSSSDATDHYEDYLNKGADFIVIGEGEQTVSDLAFQFANGTKEFQHIPGIIYRTTQNLIKTANRNVIR
ncbi:MAG TPA: cobalamin-dependent protein, partial [Flavisolibacter sp.]|nr:cobalamin-dependent protein [Flavisolibacter sp.]